MTKSKTRLVTLSRKTSIKKSIIRKAVQKAFAERENYRVQETRLNPPACG